VTGSRSTAKDGLANQIEGVVTTRGAPIWGLINAIPPVHTMFNMVLTNVSILRFPTRPNPLSTMADYTSWDSLIDRTYSSRHLPPPAVPNVDLPDVDAVVSMFTRTEFIESPKSTVLFSAFAQWFTDQFLRSDRGHPDPSSPGGVKRDLRKNESNHEIDLTSLYGLRREVTLQLRTMQGGLLKSQEIKGEEYPPYMFDKGKVKPEFSLLKILELPTYTMTADQRNKLFAMGGDTSNLQIGFVMHNVLFLREHNRVARLLAVAYPGWDDERLFSTTRNILTVLLMKIVVEDYINHITPYHFKLTLEPKSFPNEAWYRQNWMSVEFQLLYRWHSLVPDVYKIGGSEVPIDGTFSNTELVTSTGLGALFEDLSQQAAGQVGMGNTPPILWPVEHVSIQQARDVRLGSYNDYRELAGFPRVTDFNQITGNQKVQGQLSAMYKHVDKIEFYPGLFAEEAPPNSVLPPLIGRLVGLDAFSQVYTNPLLASRIYNDETFSPMGMKIIKDTKTLADVVNRNSPQQVGRYFVSMTRKGWKRQ
jgi:prostaglandin-endoperoxide synthase 2